MATPDGRADTSGGGWSGSRHGLVARDPELGTLRAHLTTGARAATVLGIAGAGKTVLVSAVAQELAAEGWAVLRVRGHATDQLLGFATLLDVLDAGEMLSPATAAGADGVRRRVDGSQALEAVPPGASTDALPLRRDLHQWLLALAEDRPLLLVVDDAQWVDAASWLVLAFVANRLAHTEVSILVASRADSPPPGLDDQPVVRLRPLDVAESLRLLERAGPVLEPMTRAAVVERAAGNPLALLELARVSGVALTADAPAAADVVPPAVEAAFAADLPSLPERTRALLLLAAAGATDLAVLGLAGGDADQVRARLEPAERAGLVRVRGSQLTFRHPLVQSTVYGLATAQQRLAVHARLAEVYADDDDRHAWHRAAATDAPAEDVAFELVRTAERLLARGATREAVEALVRASELTPDPGLRDERLLEGMSVSSAAGWVNRMAMLAEQLHRQTDNPVVRARAAHFYAYAMAQSMRQASAQEALERSLDDLAELDPEAGWASLTTLASLTYQTCQRHHVVHHWLTEYQAITENDVGQHPLNAAARAWIVMALDPLSRPPDIRQQLREQPAELPGEWPSYVHAAYDMLLGAVAWLLDEHPTALRLLTRANDVMERSRATHQLVQNTMALAQVQFDMGLYDEADRSGRLMVDIGEAQVLSYYQSVGRELRARVASVRGDSTVALATIDQLLTELEPGQSAALEANLYVARANALYGLREHEAAYQQLRRLFDVAGEPLHPHVSTRALGDLVSAAVRVGRGDEVAGLVRRAEERIADLPGERMGRVLARAKALVSDDAVAGALFERAVHEPDASTWPLEWANAQLDYAIWLRRQRLAHEARDVLRSAHQVYSRLGATPWATAAEAELRAAGVRLERDDVPDGGWSELTAQEREIVLLAASGMTNKAIGESLFLSPRTVGAHLYHAFPKLGVTSRTQLRDLVEQLRHS